MGAQRNYNKYHIQYTKASAIEWNGHLTTTKPSQSTSPLDGFVLTEPLVLHQINNLYSGACHYISAVLLN